jgi:hypothetical protein
MGFFTSILPRWATAPTAQIVEPNEGKKDAGWIAEAPPHDYFNWLLRRTYDCLLQIDAAVSAATASVLVVRDSSGRAQVIDPSVAADIDTMGARDTAIGVETTARTNADTSHANLTNPHSATAAATASRIVLRDASGRAAFADPAADGDAATKGWTDARTWQRVVASADSTCSSAATAVDIAGLTFVCESGKKYLVRAKLYCYVAATTTGMGVSAKGTSAPTTSTRYFEYMHALDTFARVQQFQNGFTDTPTIGLFSSTAADDSSKPQADEFEGYFVTTGAGTFALRLISEIDTSAVTVKVGSYLEWCEVP